MLIRPFTANDSDALVIMARHMVDYLNGLGAGISSSLTKEAFLRDGFGPDPGFDGFVAEDHGALAGYLFFTKQYDVDKTVPILYMIDLWVEPEYRRNKVGKLLVSKCEEHGRAQGYAYLKWDVYIKNPHAMAFYESIGGQYDDVDAVVLKF